MVFSIAVWSAAMSLLVLFTIDKTMGLRMTMKEELDGADILEHGIYPDRFQDFEDHSKSEKPIVLTKLQNGATSHVSKEQARSQTATPTLFIGLKASRTLGLH